jgi:hypothetical protein
MVVRCLFAVGFWLVRRLISADSRQFRDYFANILLCGLCWICVCFADLSDAGSLLVPSCFISF